MEPKRSAMESSRAGAGWEAEGAVVQGREEEEGSEGGTAAEEDGAGLGAAEDAGREDEGGRVWVGVGHDGWWAGSRFAPAVWRRL